MLLHFLLKPSKKTEKSFYYLSCSGTSHPFAARNPRVISSSGKPVLLLLPQTKRLMLAILNRRILNERLNR
jgi:hypothetical protein